MTIQEHQKNQIEEMKEHPLWEEFREAYKNHCEVCPEESNLHMMVVHNWNMFMAGAKAGVQKHMEDCH